MSFGINDPRRLKHHNPSYDSVDSDALPTIVEQQGDVSIHLLMGEYKNIQPNFVSEHQHDCSWSLRQVNVYIIRIMPHTKFQLPVKESYNSFIYGLQGSGLAYGHKETVEILPKMFSSFTRVGSSIVFENSSYTPWTFVAASAKPIKESVYRLGSLIKNTKKELLYAYEQSKQQEVGVS